MGQTAAYAITDLRIGAPRPNTRMASGMSATAGIGLRNSITTDEASRSVRDDPITTPSTTPTTIASPSPST